MTFHRLLVIAGMGLIITGCAVSSVDQSAPVGAKTVTLGAGGRLGAVPWSRSAVYGRNGMAATAHPLASQVAIDILKQGGSALDGAIAANAALGLMEPTGNGIGGDIFFIIWDPKTEQLYGYNGSGRAPLERSLIDFKSRIASLRESGAMPEDMSGIPQRGSLPVTVPGTVDGWFAAHARFGKLSMSDVLAPAVRYAREGFPITPVIAYYFERNLNAFREQEALIEELDNAAALWFPEGKTPEAGEIFRNPDLANTLELLGNEGRAAFYQGRLAKVMDTYFKRIGADMRLIDLSTHQGEWVIPGSMHYHGYDVFELPPNGQGYAALQMLNILKQVDLREYPRGSAEALHYMVEAKRLIYRWSRCCRNNMEKNGSR
jgi:gamma-glutamyltranspeptidase/glutathione hydrolase